MEFDRLAYVRLFYLLKWGNSKKVEWVVEKIISKYDGIVTEGQLEKLMKDVGYRTCHDRANAKQRLIARGVLEYDGWNKYKIGEKIIGILRGTWSD